MADKPEKSAPAPEAAAPAEAGAAPAKGGGIMGLLPLILALVLAPAISWALAQFVLLPKLKAQLVAAAPAGEGGEHGAEPAEAHAAPAKAEPAKAEPAKGHGEAKKPEAKKPEAKGHGEGKKGEGKVATEGPGSYRFDNVVVNLSGTMGTRYLKVSFLVTGKDSLNASFEERKPELFDATLNTLGSITLADLEEAGSRNLIRARLINGYNEVLGGRIVEQIFFSDFIVQ